MMPFDTETCGFHGPTVLIQYADSMDGEIFRHNVWREPIIDTLALIEKMCEEGVCGFNLTFDWFHIAQTATVLTLLGEKVGFDEWPVDHIEEYAMLEPQARFGKCLKPKTALDLMLHARKGPYQSTMDRKNIRIKRVPKVLAQKLIDELNIRIPLKEIYFARQADKKKRWQILPIKLPDKKDSYDPDFVNIELKFRPSSALKVLALDALGVKEDDVLKFGDVNVSKTYRPMEVGWAPFALAMSNPEKGWWCEIKKSGSVKKGRAWPGVIERHIDHWAFDVKATAYSIDDVKYLQQLYTYFDCPEPGDDDSVLACMVGAVRWRGFAIDREKVIALREDAKRIADSAPKAPHHVFKYLKEVMSEQEFALAEIQTSTKKVVLQTIAKWTLDCEVCNGEGQVGCTGCDGSGAIKHPAAIRAESCLLARQQKFQLSVFDKLLQADRFHVSLKVIGSLSSRMSGTDGFNALGVGHEKKVRNAFTLADGELELAGGDFSAYEVSIADARYNDPELRKQLLTCYVCQKPREVSEYDEIYCPGCGAATTKCENCKKALVIFRDGSLICQCGDPRIKENANIEDTMRKIHGLFAMELYPGKTYDQILASKGTAIDMYDYGKRGVFSQLYGGNYTTLMNRLGIGEEEAKRAELGFATRYQGIGKANQELYDKFCSMRQPDGIGKEVHWHDPAEYAESLNGFRRYFTLENNICKALYDLANDPPEEWTQLKIKCVRRDRVQKVGGAVRSAVFAAAFQIQSHSMRAAKNHEIQSTGAKETKALQVRMWSLQPVGIHKWVIQPFNVHDEIMAPVQPKYKPQLQQIVTDFVQEKKSLIPLLKIDFSTELNSWADK